MAKQASAGPIIVWFRQDLRVTDNPALAAAAAAGRPVVPVYILDEATPGDWAPGGASRWWLHQSLETLSETLDTRGAPLVLLNGRAPEVLARLVKKTGAAAVYWNRCYEPYAIARDTFLEADLKDSGVEVRSFNAALLFEPWEVATKNGEPYKVFTPFWKACLAGPAPRQPAPPPKSLTPFGDAPKGDALASWCLRPRKPNWATGFADYWTPGEAGAERRLDAFLDEALEDYAEARDRPDRGATSRLSPYLHWGEIGPRQIWHAIAARGLRDNKAAAKFLSELGWREFSYHLLCQFPGLPAENVRDAFDKFPWRTDAKALKAWQRGQTGYPIVDAGMRELWAMGWMHNRVRMVAASFLVKHLLIDWRAGARWFWDTLVDADLASNSASWQWVAGSGADAAPYFRIFNPVLQGEKFDPRGDYVRRWVPELGGLPDKFVHRPWAAPADALGEAGVALGETYPRPIVDHKAARDRALQAFNMVKG